MKDYIINQWYMAPVWIANSIYFGNSAYKNFKEMRYNEVKLLPALFWSLCSASAAGLAGMGIADGLEKILK
jgi:hypothetical protein